MAILAYLLASPPAPSRGLLIAIAAGSAVVGALSSFVLRPIARRPWRASFSLLWSLGSGWALAECVHLDGGIESPLLYLVMFPVIYAALAYRPAAVVACGVSAIAEVLVISATDAHITTSSADLLMIAAVIGGMTVLAVAASVFRARLHGSQEVLLGEIAALADTDGLTGCLNHRAFHEHLRLEIERAVRYGRALSLVVVDIDDFKSVNDAFGHTSGDEALRFVATILSDGTRKMDLLARYGGDEFVVVSAVGADDELRHVGERALHTLRGSRFVTPTEEALAMTISVGTTLVRADDESGVAVLKRADDAMYEAKHAGGDALVLLP